MRNIPKLSSRLIMHRVSLGNIHSAHWVILFVVLHVFAILVGVRLSHTQWVAIYNHLRLPKRWSLTGRL